MTRVVGIGVDVVDLTRFEQTLARSPGVRDRLFTVAEKDLPLESLAGRFAAKEALLKSLGGPDDVAWHDMEVVTGDRGAPTFRLAGQAARHTAELQVTGLHVSISHDGGIATAFVIAEAEG